MGSSDSGPLEYLLDNVCVCTNTGQDAWLLSNAMVLVVFSFNPLPLLGHDV